MRRLLILCCCLFPALTAQAWNGAGHRLSAVIAWQQLGPGSRAALEQILRQHPDHGRWVERSGTGETALVFAEASTWPDSIRHDPRFYDARRDTPTPTLTGFPDMQRHSDWHYVDFAADGSRGRGQIDRQIEQLAGLLRSTAETGEIAWALPWLAHLVGDIHQPLHVGHSADAGGNDVLVEDPFSPRKPFVRLHSWWDDLPGPSNLRGKRLLKQAETLLARHAPPDRGDVVSWREESRQLLAQAYPSNHGSVSLRIDSSFRSQALTLAERRIVAAGYRLGLLLEHALARRVPRETQPAPR